LFEIPRQKALDKFGSGQIVGAEIPEKQMFFSESIEKSGKPSVQSPGLKFLPNNQPFFFGCATFKESRKISWGGNNQAETKRE
jgi:hypothetical protein